MSTALFSIPLLLFVLFVAPLWLWLHYRSKRQDSKNATEEDVEKMHLLDQRTQALQERIYALERILDDESPDWRQK